jgi:hypothetical protein
MNCIKSNNHLVNTLLFPGSVMLSSYDTDTFVNKYSSIDHDIDFDSDELQLIYIPFEKSERLLNICDAPKYIPSLLQVAKKNSGAVFVIHMHGNACDIGHISMCAKRESYSLNAHYLIVEYPSYGISNGYANENLIDEIAYCVYKFVNIILKVPSHKIVLFGRSIGTGPVVRLASILQIEKKKPAAIILQSPYSSLKNAAQDLVGSCISSCMFDRWQNWKVLCGDYDNITCPVLFIHADNDQIIDIYHSEAMHQIRTKKGLLSSIYIQKSTYDFIKGHNHYDYDVDVIIPIRDFLARYVPFSGLWSINLDIIKQYITKPNDFPKFDMNTSKVCTITNCIRWSYCPCIACCEAGTAMFCSLFSICCNDNGEFQYQPKKLRHSKKENNQNNMKKVKRFLKTGSIRSTMDEELDNNDKNSTINPVLKDKNCSNDAENNNKITDIMQEKKS